MSANESRLVEIESPLLSPCSTAIIAFAISNDFKLLMQAFWFATDRCPRTHTNAPTTEANISTKQIDKAFCHTFISII
jgi:hypothetical protein